MDCFGYWAKQVHEIMSQPWARKWCDASGTRVGLEVEIHSDSEEFLLSYVWKVGMGTARLEEWGAICLGHWTPKDMPSTSRVIVRVVNQGSGSEDQQSVDKEVSEKGKTLGFSGPPFFS